ncbi:MAG: hypothetical protein M5U29_02075 [Anaerolineae bacterium]|nr:hypothetical protein [Anaerolineae bacterium]
MVRTATLELATDGNGQVIDFTEALPGVLYGTGLQHGTATVFCPQRHQRGDDNGQGASKGCQRLA